MRATQLLQFINVEIIPGSEEIRHYYTHLNVTDRLKDIRRSYRRDLKRDKEGREDYKQRVRHG